MIKFQDLIDQIPCKLVAFQRSLDEEYRDTPWLKPRCVLFSCDCPKCNPYFL